MNRDKTYILDTSALLTYIEDENGATYIEDLLVKAEKGEVFIYVSFISLTEVYYITIQEKGESTAEERIELIKSLAIIIEESGEVLNLLAGKIKASNRLSLADAFIVALCQQQEGILVHKDPEFDNLSLIEQYKLPYKSS